MELVTLEQLRKHCNLDPDDVSQDDMLTFYAEVAEAACAKRANRALFVDQAAMDTARDGIEAAITAARAAYVAAEEVALAKEDAYVRDMLLKLAQRKFDEVDLANHRALVGIIATKEIIGAVLLTAAHFYNNRDEVVVGVGASAVVLPEGAGAIMDRNFYTGA